MNPAELLRALLDRGLILVPQGGHLRCRYPKGALSPEEVEALRGLWSRAREGDHEALVAFAEVLLGPQLGPWGPPSRCRSCKGTQWWQRPPSMGGGWVCAVCHPVPPGVTPVVTE